jgi:hypothetical protein
MKKVMKFKFLCSLINLRIQLDSAWLQKGYRINHEIILRRSTHRLLFHFLTARVSAAAFTFLTLLLL